VASHPGEAFDSREGGRRNDDLYPVWVIR